MKKNLLSKLLFIVTLSIITSSAFSQVNGDFRSVASGVWATAATWEKYNSTTSAWAVSGAPSNAASTVTIRAGHVVTIGASASACNLVIESGATLNANASSLGTTVTLNLGSATYPNVTLTNNGIFGDATGVADGIVLQSATTCTSLTVTGPATNGTTIVNSIARFRPNYPNPSALVINIDQSMSFGYNNVCFTGYYSGANNTAAENCTVNINAGKTVKISHPSGGIHGGSKLTNPQGTVVYNINGVLDLSAMTTVQNFVPDSVTATGNATMNISGLVKLGTGGLNMVTNLLSYATIGTAKIVIKTGGVLDATLANAITTSTSNNGSFLILEGTGVLKRTVGSTATIFPVGLSTTSYNPVTLTNTGTSDSFSVSLKSTFDNAPVLPTSVVNKQWTINKLGTQSVNVLAGFGWLTADEGTTFVRANTVNVMQYSGGSWTNFGLANPSVTGSGTAADPYFASSNNFTAFGNFGVTNGSVLPVIFGNVSAAKTLAGTDVSWIIATEINTAKYVIEKSIDGRSFSAIGSIAASNAGKYSFTDLAVNNGINFYRIKAIDKDGSYQYSAVVSVNINNTSVNVKVYPNPVVNGDLNVQLSNLNKGNYSINIYNTIGQVIYTKSIVYDGLNTVLSIALPATVKTGIYNLAITDEVTKITKTINVQ